MNAYRGGGVWAGGALGGRRGLLFGGSIVFVQSEASSVTEDVCLIAACQCFVLQGPFLLIAVELCSLAECMHVCMYIRIYVCVYIYLYMYMHLYMNT